MNLLTNVLILLVNQQHQQPVTQKKSGVKFQAAPVGSNI